MTRLQIRVFYFILGTAITFLIMNTLVLKALDRLEKNSQALNCWSFNAGDNEAFNNCLSNE